MLKVISDLREEENSQFQAITATSSHLQRERRLEHAAEVHRSASSVEEPGLPMDQQRCCKMLSLPHLATTLLMAHWPWSTLFSTSHLSVRKKKKKQLQSMLISKRKKDSFMRESIRIRNVGMLGLSDWREKTPRFNT